MVKPQSGFLRNFRSKSHRKETIFILLMLAIPFAHFLVFWLYPNLRSITIAFEVPSIEGPTLYNFKRFFGELFSDIHGPQMWKMIDNSMIMFVVSTFINLPLVLFLSYIMFKKVRGYKVFRILFYLPSILGATVMTQIYKSLLMTGGPIEQLLDLWNVPMSDMTRFTGLLGSKETGMLMLVIYTLWTGVGVNMIMFTGAMNRVPQEIFESARIDGIGFFREFFNIILPLIWPTVTTNRDNAPETLGVFDIYSWTTADGYVDNIQGVLDEGEPSEPTEPEEPTEPDGMELNFTANVGAFMEVEPKAYEVIRFEYQLAANGQMTLILRDPNWVKYYGDFTFDTNGLVWSYQTGITTEKLDNGYIRVTMILDELNRSGLADNRDNAPETIGVFDVYSWTSVDGHIQNIELLMEFTCEPEDPTEPEEPTEPEIPTEPDGMELNFTAGVESFLEVTPNAYKIVRFDYKLASEGTMVLILRDPNWGKYYGSIEFNNDGQVWDYQTGITTEKLDDGYIRVTLMLDELNRSGMADNRDNAPETIGIFDIFSSTTVDGHIDNIELLMELPQDEETLELEFTAGVESFIEVTPDAYKIVRFDYKLASEGTMVLILRDPNWGKYYGSIEFNNDGQVWDYQTGITTEKLDNGYIRVTLMLDELNRSGMADNRDNAPETIGIFDIFSSTTVDGHIDNIELLMELPDQSSRNIGLKLFKGMRFQKPRLWDIDLLEQDDNAE